MYGKTSRTRFYQLAGISRTFDESRMRPPWNPLLAALQNSLAQRLEVGSSRTFLEAPDRTPQESSGARG